ncbi:MAG: DUF58 domain-containing protein [Panacagrimonas sp.]
MPGVQALVDYRVRWKPGGVLPGAYRGTVAGSGNEIRAVVPLSHYPDPRRLDLRTTLRDPFQQLWVRDFKQTTSLKVFVLADVSASMGFRGRHDKYVLLRHIAKVLAHSAWKSGDRFGLYAADEQLHTELSLPARVNRGAADWLDQRLAAFTPTGRSATGLLDALAELPTRRALVFVLSDFHWPEGELHTLLRRLTHHDVVPVVLWDPAETEDIPAHGFARVRDSETGSSRFVWLRPSLKQQLREAREQQRERIESICRSAARRPFFITDGFDPHQMTRYFLEAV